MMTPSKKLYYAVEAVVYIAYNAKARPVSSREIARQQGLPPRYLEQILQKLVHGGVLKGVRGPGGGYMPVDMATSLKCICGLINDEPPIETLPPTTSIGDSIIKPLWQSLNETLEDVLQGVTIADLCRRAEDSGINS